MKKRRPLQTGANGYWTSKVSLIRLVIFVSFVQITYAREPKTLDGSRSLSSSPLLAETRLNGQVTDEQTNEPLPGVSIVAKGTSRGTTTDANGRYQLTVPDKTTVLVFSFVGYTSREVLINNRTTVDASLPPDNQTLNEVVVVGYGTVRKSDLTGSVSSVTAE